MPSSVLQLSSKFFANKHFELASMAYFAFQIVKIIFLLLPEVKWDRDESACCWWRRFYWF